ncbi:MAG TPA: hypothetical protein VFZ65_21540 [Planctomycetota bacterium]|nr:hypothetical protein [Planctomycetota bacterium]
MEELNDRLRQFAADRHRQAKLANDLQQIAAQLERHECARQRWQEQVRISSEDLRRLRGSSLLGLFHALLGDRREKIDGERERLLKAKLAHDECETSIAPLLAERERVQRELTALGDLGARHAELLAAKEAALRARGGKMAEQVTESSERIGLLESTLREIEEAIAVGKQAESALDLAAENLRQARRMGHADLLGAGMLVTHAKHTNIDAARSWVDRAQRHLQNFARELGDVARTSPDLTIDISGIDRFADHFFDGLIADWRVQGKLVAALDRVVGTLDRTRELVWDLERRARTTKQTLDEVRRQRTAWIEGAS